MSLGLGLGLAKGPALRSIAQRVRSLFSRLGSNAHMYLPGAQTPVLGPELVTNGDFSNGTTGWSIGTGFSVSDGKLVINGGNAGSVFTTSVAQLATVVGRTYRAQFGYTLTSGRFRLNPVSGVTTTLVTAGSGTYTQDFVATAAGDLFIQAPDAATVGSIDNISVREILSYNDVISGFHTGNYVESTGVTPASVDQPVGLVLDAAGSVGAELAGLSTAWQAYGTGISLSGGQMIFTSAPAGQSAMRGTPLVANKTYIISFTIASISGGGIQMLVAGGAGTVNATTPGTYTANVRATNADGPYLWVNTAATTAVVTAASCKEITGIHASQSTSGFRPVERRGIVNLLTYSQDFSNAAWSLNGATRTGGVSDPLGGASAFTLGFASAFTHIKQYSTAFPDGASGTVTLWVKSSASGGASNVRITTNNTLAWNTGISNKVALTSQWQLVVASGVLQSANSKVGVVLGTLDASGTPDATCLGNVDVYMCGVFQGTLTAQQILAMGGIPLTTTAAASSAMGPYYLEHKAANSQRLNLGSVPFQMADDFVVVCAARVDSLASLRAIFGAYSSSANNPRIQVYTDATTGVIRAQLRDDAGTIIGPATGAAVVGVPFVVSLVKRSGQAFIRVNGVQSSSGSTASLGTTTLDSFAIGETKGAMHEGAIYCCIPIKGTLTDAEITLLEKQAALLAGVTLP